MAARRGRPPGSLAPADVRKDAMLRLRLRERDLLKLDRYARKQGQTLSQWAREILFRAAGIDPKGRKGR